MTTAQNVLDTLSAALSASLGVYGRPGGATAPAIRWGAVPAGWTPPVTGLEVLIQDPEHASAPLLNREYHLNGIIHVRVIAHGGVSLEAANRRIISLYPLATIRFIPETDEYPAQMTIQIPTQ